VLLLLPLLLLLWVFIPFSSVPCSLSDEDEEDVTKDTLFEDRTELTDALRLLRLLPWELVPPVRKIPEDTLPERDTDGEEESDSEGDVGWDCCEEGD
jgi:hypothetical protein